MATSLQEPAACSPLEWFVRDYVEAAGGVWEEIEPQVYDVLLPAPGPDAELDGGGRGLFRLAFDPEALPEHPGAELAGFGTPLVDRLLQDAARRGRYAEFYLNGLNLAPYDLAGRVRRFLGVPEGARLDVRGIRPLDFPQAVFWFQATFASDQKEHEILRVGVDLHTAREVRHLERLLDDRLLGEEPSVYLPEVRRASVASAYPLARQEVLRTLSALANARHRELSGRVRRQIDRMSRYYHDLRSELEEQIRRARNRQDDPARFDARREALDREERLRVAELKQKSALRVYLRLIHLLMVRQPKLLLHSALVPAQAAAPALELELVWDPLLEAMEPAACPQCHRPTMAFQWGCRARLVCGQCAVGEPTTQGNAMKPKGLRNGAKAV